MLSPDSRIVGFEVLRPPAKYRLDFAVLTTYSLDLEAVLTLPLSVISQADGGVEDLLVDPLLLLEALREAGEHIHVFVDRARIAIPRKERELYSMLEESIHPVQAPGDGAFHPKVWVLRFLADNKPVLLRVAVLSRNLTFDRSWDTVLASESSLSLRRRATASRPLAKLIRSLPDLCTEPLKSSVIDQIGKLADQTEHCRFPPPEGFLGDAIKFHDLGLSRRRKPWPPRTDVNRTLAIAPFVDRAALGSIIEITSGKRMLVSRQEELDKLPENALDDWDNIRVLSDTALDELEDGAADRPSDLHAKILAVEHGWDVTWHVGSANITTAAHTGRNVELMATLTARKGRKHGNTGYGIERFLESGFDNLCVEYQRRDTEAGDIEEDLAIQHLEEVRSALLDARLKIKCVPDSDAWIWRLEGPTVLEHDDVEVAVWPISIAEVHARPLELPLSWTLPIHRLTRFVAFRLRATTRKVSDIRFTLKIHAPDMPMDRMHHVLRALIDNPDRFLRFLRALLGGLEGISDWKKGDGKGGGTGVWGGVLNENALLEDLVRTASREPSRLEPVRRLINDFCKTAEGRQIVPDALLGVWNAVDDALREDG